MSEIMTTVKTMSSMELAELLEARHNDVASSIARLMEQGVLRESRKSTRPHKNEAGGRPTMVYDLTHRDSLVVASGYSAQLRARIIDRWIELEREDRPKPVAELSRMELLQIAMAAEQERLLLAEKVARDAPKVEFAEAVRNTDALVNVGDLAKVLGWGRNKLFKQLRDDGILMAGNKPYQRYVDQGWFKMVEGTPVKRSDGSEFTVFTTMVTGKGQVALQRRYAPSRNANAGALTVMENRLH